MRHLVGGFCAALLMSGCVTASSPTQPNTPPAVKWIGDLYSLDMQTTTPASIIFILNEDTYELGFGDDGLVHWRVDTSTPPPTP